MVRPCNCSARCKAVSNNCSITRRLNAAGLVDSADEFVSCQNIDFGLHSARGIMTNNYLQIPVQARLVRTRGGAHLRSQRRHKRRSISGEKNIEPAESSGSTSADSLTQLNITADLHVWYSGMHQPHPGATRHRFKVDRHDHAATIGRCVAKSIRRVVFDQR